MPKNTICRKLYQMLWNPQAATDEFAERFSE